MMQTTRQRKLFQTTSLVCIRFLCLAGVIIGQILQFTDPLIVSKTSKMFAGPWSFLTILAGFATILVMLFGFISQLQGRWRRHHMHLVSIIYPVESVVTIFSWAMFFLKKDDMLPSKSPDGKQLTTLPFEITHYCLHLLPLIGLMADYATHFRHYIYSHLQAVSLAAWGFGYLGWMCFCRYMDSHWPYKAMKSSSNVSIALFFSLSLLCMYSTWFFLIFMAYDSKRHISDNSENSKKARFIPRRIRLVVEYKKRLPYIIKAF